MVAEHRQAGAALAGDGAAKGCRLIAVDVRWLGEIFHRGNLGAGMRAAIKAIGRGYRPLIEAWRR